MAAEEYGEESIGVGLDKRQARRRRRRGRSSPRCKEKDCGRPIKWLRVHGSWRPFDPKPVDGRTHDGTAAAYPVEGHTAWLFVALVDELMGRRSISRAEAEEEAYDMPWHQVHVCREGQQQ